MLTNTAHNPKTLPSILKNMLESTLYPVGPPVSSSNADAERERGMPQLGNGGEGRFCNTLGSCIQTLDDEFVQTFRWKTSSIKPVVEFCVLSHVAYISVHRCVRVREKCRGGS